jgi:NAD(P)-dependent dehydrogenase (short-subunit alcohol dehydrogenase family)
MPRTVVITGGTDGIGAAVARALFTRGDHAVVVGTNPEKGKLLTEEAAGNLTFVPADLSLVSENRRVVEQIIRAHPEIDGLVLCARYFRATRRVTPEGFEDSFALSYLSRLVLSFGLQEAMSRKERSVVVNVSGPGHDTPIDWGDLQTAENYSGMRAMFAAGRYNDLLGVDFAEKHGDGPVRYVLLNPGATATSYAGEYDAGTAAIVERQKATAKPASEVAAVILPLIDKPPARPLSAVTMTAELDIHSGLFDPGQAARLATTTEAMLRKPQLQ